MTLFTTSWLPNWRLARDGWVDPQASIRQHTSGAGASEASTNHMCRHCHTPLGCACLVSLFFFCACTQLQERAEPSPLGTARQSPDGLHCPQSMPVASRSGMPDRAALHPCCSCSCSCILAQRARPHWQRPAVRRSTRTHAGCKQPATSQPVHVPASQHHLALAQVHG
jgi:hypothetical protein